MIGDSNKNCIPRPYYFYKGQRLLECPLDHYPDKENNCVINCMKNFKKVYNESCRNECPSNTIYENDKNICVDSK